MIHVLPFPVFQGVYFRAGPNYKGLQRGAKTPLEAGYRHLREFPSHGCPRMFGLMLLVYLLP